MPISISGPSIVRYFLEKKVYWAVFFAEFGLDLKIVRYLMGGINHTACVSYWKGKLHTYVVGKQKQATTVVISVQAEIFLFSDPTFLDGFDLKFHMPGHFPPWDVVFTCHPGHFAILHKNRTKLQ